MKLKERNHGLLANIIFYLKIWKDTFPLGLLFMLLTIPLQILSIYQMIRIPQIIISGVETASDLRQVVYKVLLAFIISTLAGVSKKILDSQLMTRGSRPLMWLYSKPVHEKLFKMDYEKLMSASVQNKLAKVENLVIRGADGGPIHFFAFNLSSFLIALTGIVIFSPNILMIDASLMLIIIISAFINLGYSIYSGRYSTKNMRERSQWEKKELYFVKICEDRAYSKDIRFYNLLESINKAYAYYHKGHTSFLKKEANVHFAGGLLNASLLLLRDGLAYGYLISQLTRGVLSVSQFVFLIALVRQFSMWMDGIVLNARHLILFSSQMENFRDFLDLEDGIKEGNLGVEDVGNQVSIDFNRISYHYPDSDKYIFKDFSLNISPGEKIALVGINGAGKTSLMYLLMGLLHPTEGSILIDKKDSRDFSKEEYYKLFSPVFQDIYILPENIGENIAGESPWDEEKLDKAIEGAGLKEFICSLKKKEKTDLVRESKKDAIDLSGGLNQRLLLARALYKDGKINILDEPTAALDPIAESRIYEEYDNMSKDKTSIFISHRLASTRFCDRILLLEGGKIMEEGNHNDLMAKDGQYAEMYRLQSKYYQDKKRGEVI